LISIRENLKLATVIVTLEGNAVGKRADSSVLIFPAVMIHKVHKGEWVQGVLTHQVAEVIRGILFSGSIFSSSITIPLSFPAPSYHSSE
jgi:hypothetical protein